ncbi:MAG: hypothetical protein F6K16_11775, partial [Symploca sp. SIO2B6]|nr:hypothetical protein [Symploca sp. SIO2B6]
PRDHHRERIAQSWVRWRESNVVSMGRTPKAAAGHCADHRPRHRKKRTTPYAGGNDRIHVGLPHS